MENHPGYYTKPNSTVMKPIKEPAKQAIADTIFKLLADHNLPSFVALDILSRVRNKVIAYQGAMDQSYHEGEGGRNS